MARLDRFTNGTTLRFSEPTLTTPKAIFRCAGLAISKRAIAPRPTMFTLSLPVPLTTNGTEKA